MTSFMVCTKNFGVEIGFYLFLIKVKFESHSHTFAAWYGRHIESSIAACMQC